MNVNEKGTPIPETPRKSGMRFRWRYILLPLLLLIVSLGLVAVFYGKVPDEIAYRFAGDGSPDRWSARGTVTFWLLLPQVVFTLMSAGIVWAALGLIRRYDLEGTALISPESIVFLMANMVALPQIIFCFALLDIFSYNSYQIRLMPLWVFTLIVLGTGGIIIGIFFLRAIRVLWRTGKELNSD